MGSSFAESWREYAASFSVTLITAAAGTTVGWTSPTLPILLSKESSIPTTPDESSWMASLMILSSTFSPLPAAYMADRFGRKATLLLSGIPYVIGWVMIMFANNVGTIYASRMISGIGYGIAYTTAPMYIGEIASDERRGSLATLITVMSKFGILLQYCVGPFVSMTTLAAVNLALPILFLGTFSFAPETPYFYLKDQRRDEAQQSLMRLRGKRDIQNDLNDMELLVNKNMKQKGRWVDLIREMGNRKALIIILGIYTVQQFCGSTAVISYCQQIFSQSIPTFSPTYACILFGTVQLCTSAASSMLVDRLGRRPLLILSAAGLAITNLIVGTYFFFDDRHYEYASYFSMVPVIILPIYIFSYTIGIATVPFAITSELFPTNVKSYATCVIQMYTSLSTFAVTKLYQVVADNMGIYMAFWGFAAFSFIGVFFIASQLPETKGLSFAAIQRKLNIDADEKQEVVYYSKGKIANA